MLSNDSDGNISKKKKKKTVYDRSELLWTRFGTTLGKMEEVEAVEVVRVRKLYRYAERKYILTGNVGPEMRQERRVRNVHPRSAA